MKKRRIIILASVLVIVGMFFVVGRGTFVK